MPKSVFERRRRQNVLSAQGARKDRHRLEGQEIRRVAPAGGGLRQAAAEILFLLQQESLTEGGRV